VSEQLQFLELSIPAPDVQESLAWYQTLGFSELPTTDAHSRRYGVVSIGNFCIGLYGENLDSPGLTFVRRNLANYVRSRQEAGQEFEQTQLGIDAFHEARQRDPDGTLAILLEARTFSPGHTQTGLLAIGDLLNVALPCMDNGDSLRFWQGYGFIGVENSANAAVELHTPGLTLELAAGTRQLTLRLQPADFAACMRLLERNHSLKAFATGVSRGVELTAPEGTRIQFLDQIRD
jgi:hypothetical protein